MLIWKRVKETGGEWSGDFCLGTREFALPLGSAFVAHFTDANSEAIPDFPQAAHIENAETDREGRGVFPLHFGAKWSSENQEGRDSLSVNR